MVNPMVGTRVDPEVKRDFLKLCKERKWTEAQALRYILEAALKAISQNRLKL